MKISFNKFLMGCMALAVLSCNRTVSDSATKVEAEDSVVFFTVRGVVKNAEDSLLGGVKVTAADTFVYTDSAGAFSIPAVVKDGRVLVKVEKDGYFYHVCSQSVKDTLCHNIALVQKKTSKFAYAGEFMANKGFSMTVDGGKVSIPANALVKADGSAYNGAVKVGMCYLNPENKMFTSLMPGGDLCAIDAKGKTVHLISYGMVRVEMESDKGEKLQLKKGAKAKLRFPVTALQSKSPIDTIPLWYFDEETGLWKEEGLSVKKNGYYEGEVGHFTWWNCDKEFENGGKIKVRFKDATGKYMNGLYNIYFEKGYAMYFRSSDYYSLPADIKFKVGEFFPVKSDLIMNDLIGKDAEMQTGLKEGEERELEISLDKVLVKVTVNDKNGQWGQFDLCMKPNTDKKVSVKNTNYTIKWKDVKNDAYTLTLADPIEMIRVPEHPVNKEVTVSGKIGKYTYVDLGLKSGTKWATYNVGASKPSEYGDYFAWGEITPKKVYTGSTYKWYYIWRQGRDNYANQTKYCVRRSYGRVDSLTTLLAEDDAATVNWGAGWRMPTRAEQCELRDGCDWEWTDDFNGSGVAGCIGTSKTNGNTVFLPAAGDRGVAGLNGAGNSGQYWSSSLNEYESNYAYDLGFHFVAFGSNSHYDRYSGMSVRAVVK